MKINWPKIRLSKSQAASLGIVGYFVGQAVINSVTQGHVDTKSLTNAALAGVAAAGRSLLPALSGENAAPADDKSVADANAAEAAAMDAMTPPNP